MAKRTKDPMEVRLVKLFGSTSRPRLLSLFLSQPHRAFYQREIMFETSLSLQAVQRELENLLSLGIFKRRGAGGRVYYESDRSSPWFETLREICVIGGEK